MTKDRFDKFRHRGLCLAEALPDLQIQTRILCKGNQRLGQTHVALGRLLVEVGHVIQPIDLLHGNAST